MAQAFGSICSNVEYEVEAMTPEQLVYELDIAKGTVDEFRTLWNVIDESSAEIVQHNDLVPSL